MSAANRLRSIIGSDAFEALEAYLRERERNREFVTNPDANDPHEHHAGTGFHNPVGVQK